MILIGMAFQLFPSRSPAQVVTKLNGGNLKFELSISTNLLYGYQSTSGGSISSKLNRNVGAIYWNPAALSQISRAQVSVDYAPPVYVGINTIKRIIPSFNVGDLINKQVDSWLPTNKYQAGVSPVYPGVEFKDNFPGGIKSFGLVTAPYHDYTFGISYSSPLEIHASLFGSGTNFSILRPDSLADINFVITSIGTNTAVDMTISTYSFAVSRRFSDEFSAGITIDRNYMNTTIRGDYLLDGLIYVTHGGASGGSTASYNDPNVPGNDNLNSSAHGNFHGSNFGLKIGTSYRPAGSKFSLDGVFVVPTKIKSSGGLDLFERLPPFLNLGNANSLIDINKYDFAMPTRTKTIWTHGDKLDFNFPGSLALGATYQMAFMTSSFTFTTYFNEASFEYHATVIDSEKVKTDPNYHPTEASSHSGIKLKTGLNLAFQFPALTIGLGMITADIINGNKKTATILPKISMAAGTPIGNAWRIDGLFLAEINPFMRLSLTYYMDQP
jgi:hypothetical protein